MAALCGKSLSVQNCVHRADRIAPLGACDRRCVRCAVPGDGAAKLLDDVGEVDTDALSLQDGVALDGDSGLAIKDGDGARVVVVALRRRGR